jgi:uncharacterized membrane protein YhaH (DUF805 family)
VRDGGFMSTWQTLFSLQGRMPRGRFWLATIVWTIPYMIFTAIIIGIVSGGKYPDAKFHSMAGSERINGLGLLIGMSLFVFPSLAISAKRLHDLNCSALWCAVFWGPSFVFAGAQFLELTGPIDVLNPVGRVLSYTAAATGHIGLLIGCFKGNAGTNRFGPDPFDKLDGPIN